MPATYTLIASNTLSSAAASVTFSAIPATYTDLVLRVSARSDFNGGDAINFQYNNDATTKYSVTTIEGGFGTTPYSNRTTNDTQLRYTVIPTITDTSNTFSSVEMYIPSYTVAQNKPSSTFNVYENNSTTSFAVGGWANLYRSTTAISSIKCFLVQSGASFVSGSSFFLYGIKNS